MTLHNAITDVPGIEVGHAHDEEALTGCTVVLCRAGAVGGVDQRGGAPGTRETDLLRPLHLVETVHAVVLAGGSAYGLDAASGVMRYLEEHGVGFETRVCRVPIVPAAVLFDLELGRSGVRPDAAMGYRACENAGTRPPAEGNAGAGIGATVGKVLGMGRAMKAGIGTASLELGAGIVVGALAAVNAFGDVLDPATDRIVAGARAAAADELEIGAPGYFADTMQVLKGLAGEIMFGFADGPHTVLGVVATNARLSKAGANKVAQMAHDGLARTIRPAHTLVDGDTIFCLSTGERPADPSIVGAFAADVMAAAILRGARAAGGAGGVPGAAR